MPKYTQGPWSGGCEAINDQRGRLLANVNYKGYSGDIPVEEGHANSNLISAAPDLYEALLQVLIWHEDLSDKVYGNPKRNTLAWQVKEALNKAEGRKCSQ